MKLKIAYITNSKARPRIQISRGQIDVGFLDY